MPAPEPEPRDEPAPLSFEAAYARRGPIPLQLALVGTQTFGPGPVVPWEDVLNGRIDVRHVIEDQDGRQFISLDLETWQRAVATLLARAESDGRY